MKYNTNIPYIFTGTPSWFPTAGKTGTLGK